MSNTFTVHVGTFDQPLFEGEAEALICPSTLGEVTILPHHSSLIATLKKGIVRVRGTDKTKEPLCFEINSGVLEVSGNSATVLL